MTTSNIYEPTRTVGNGIVVAFTFNFKLDDETDMDVYLIDTGANTNKVLQTITTDYTVAINTTSEGGTITFGTPPPSTKDVILERTEDYTQPTDIPDVATIQESVLEDSYDKNTRLIQQIFELTSRKIGISVEDKTLVSSFDPEIDNFTSGAILQVNGDATGITATALASLSAIGVPTTSGIAVYTGANTFVARELLTSGSVIVTNPKGLTGDITVETTVLDIKVSAAEVDISALQSNVTELQVNKFQRLSLSLDATDVTNSQSIAHTLSGIPTDIVCLATDGLTATDQSSNGQCFTDGSTFVQAATGFDDSGANGASLHADSIAGLGNADGTAKQLYKITGATASAITLLNTKTGSPTGTHLLELLLKRGG